MLLVAGRRLVKSGLIQITGSGWLWLGVSASFSAGDQAESRAPSPRKRLLSGGTAGTPDPFRDYSGWGASPDQVGLSCRGHTGCVFGAAEKRGPARYHLL